MAATRRIDELMEMMQSFSKPKYQKSELLDEMLALQKEIVELTFNGKHASTADLKLWDVEKHLEQLNQSCGNVAEEELQNFKKESKTFCNIIKAEISGVRGETKAFRTLQNIRTRNIVLKNVELGEGDQHTELDAVVIMPEAIAIIEVKNTAKNIFIDENGDYYRTGEFLRWDCNIAEKMRIKEDLLRKTLDDIGIRNIPIQSIVVFTDNRIEVHNKFPSIRTCFVSQLTYILDSFKGNRVLTENEMINIETAIRDAECIEAYSFKFDVEQFKRDFATLMAILEEESAKENASLKEETESTEGTEKKHAKIFKSEYVGYVGSAVAAAAITFISTMVFDAIKGGRFFK